MKKITVLVLSFLVGAVLLGMIPSSGYTQKVDLSHDFTGMGNPASVYCQGLGYNYRSVTEEGGERGVCELPDDKVCDAWSFLQGECGKEFSHCAQMGYETVVKSDGKNPFSRTYAVCVDENQEVVGQVTALFDLSEKSLGCGLKGDVFLDENQSEPESSDLEGFDATPPASFDWRDYEGENWLTPVRNQGGCGSCWAFSAVGVAEAVIQIADGDPDSGINLAEQYLVSDCNYSSDGYQSCCGGSKAEGLGFIETYGIPDEGCMNYVDGGGCSCDDGTCDSNCTYGYPECSDRECADRCGDWDQRLDYIEDHGYVGTDPETIKNALIHYGPLGVSMGIRASFGGYFDGDGIYRCTDDSGTNHAVVLVGYDDIGEYWIVRNSWGSGWDGDGYFKLGYDDAAPYGQCHIRHYVWYGWDNVPPNVPNTPVPTDGSSDQPLNSHLTWIGGDPNDGDTVTYDVYFEAGDATPDSLLCDDVDLALCNPGTLSEGITYYWQVVSTDNHGISSTGPVWEFTTQSVTDWYVSESGNDGNDCLSPGSACETIQGAIDKAANGDWIHVAAGTYPEYLHITTNLIIEGAGAESTIIDPGGSSVGYVICNGAETTIRGFTITGTGANQTSCGWASGEGSAISGGSPLTLEKNIIRDNHRGVSGGSEVYLYNNFFINNAAWGVYASSWDQVVAYNNTFIDNDPGIAIFGEDASLVAKNNIFDGNTIGVKLTYATVAHTVSYNLNNDGWEKVTLDGTNITGNPCFVDRAGSDLHLGRCSAAIDAGIIDGLGPVDDYDGEGRFQGGGIDMGADESSFFPYYAIADFDGDKDTDISVFKVEPWGGMWYVKDQTAQSYGNSDSIPIPADYDGDGTKDIAVYNDGTWYVRDQFVDTWGDADSVPLPGDYDGDGTTDLTVFKVEPWGGMWYIKDLTAFSYGNSESIPVPGDYDGDGTTDVAVYNDGTWYIKDQFVDTWGDAESIPVPGDYDGDGITDIAVYKVEPWGGMWYIKDQAAHVYGNSESIPVSGDYDGDGTIDVAVYNDGIWYVKDRFVDTWGDATSYPLPAPDTNGDGDPYQ